MSKHEDMSGSGSGLVYGRKLVQLHLFNQSINHVKQYSTKKTFPNRINITQAFDFHTNLVVDNNLITFWRIELYN